MSEQSGTSADRAKGFVASVLDVSFTEFVTTRLVKVLYVLTLIGIAILYVIIAVSIFSSGSSVSSFDRSTGQIVTLESGGNTGLGLLWLFVLGPLAAFLYTLLYRVFFELVIVIFRIFEFNREQTELLRRMVPGGETSTVASTSSPEPPSREPPGSHPSWGGPAG